MAPITPMASVEIAPIVRRSDRVFSGMASGAASGVGGRVRSVPSGLVDAEPGAGRTAR